jgi:hypothetical protein
MDPDEFAPGHAASGADGAEACRTQPVAHCRRRDDDPEAFELAGDALVAPSRFSRARRTASIRTLCGSVGAHVGRCTSTASRPTVDAIEATSPA